MKLLDGWIVVDGGRGDMKLGFMVMMRRELRGCQLLMVAARLPHQQ